MDAKSAAKELGISLALVYELARERRIGHVRIGRRGRRGKLIFSKDDIDEFMAAHRQEVAAELADD